MPITYTNRKGVAYTLYQVQAGAGATRHVFARQSKGTQADEIPAGFRVSENASGVVSLVKDQPSLVRPEEVAAVETAVRRLPNTEKFRVVGQHDRIELYAELDPFGLYRGLLAGGYELPGGEEGLGAIVEHPARYDPVLRFVLIDPARRLFRADEKLSFWGAQEWRWLEQTGAIAELARVIVPGLANRPVDDPFRFDSIVPTAQASVRPNKGTGVRSNARYSPAPPTSVHRLKVTLVGSRPPIWRRLLVPSDITLDRLHHVLQLAMGWDDSHLHQFQIDGMIFSDPRFLDDTGNPAEWTVRLDQVVPFPKTRFRYQYDFGDSWDHEILVEAVQPPEPGMHYPACIAGKRAGPPEDCGGVWGYAYLIEALSDPENPDHAERLEWLGGPFDPEAFDLDAVNQQLARYGRRG